MINRELDKVYIYTYSDTTDDYGQLRQSQAKNRQAIEMMTKPYSHRNTDDMRYSEVELIGLTKYMLADSKVVEVNGQNYDVLFTLPSKRWNQVFLRKSHD